MNMTTTPKRRAARAEARIIALMGGPRSPEAAAMVDHVMADIVPIITALKPEGKRFGPSSERKVRTATGALLADLLELRAGREPNRTILAGIHGMSPKDFSAKRLGFARSIFMDVVRAMQDIGLLKVTTGTPRWKPAFGNFIVRGGDMTNFRLTPKALAMTERYGVSPDVWGDHWQLVSDRPLPPSTSPRLLLRSTRRRVNGKKQDAVDLDFDEAAKKPKAILKDLAALNDFLDQQHIGGIAFPGLRRIFNNGDEDGYAWDKGGRYYSLPGGHAYEVRGSAWRRSTITINGEAVDEADLRASHLTLLHAMLDRPFDPHVDPYGVPDLPRAVVKAWVTQVLGSGDPWSSRWNTKTIADFEAERPHQFLQDEYPFKEVRSVVLERHPVLAELKEYGIDSLTLQYHEAEILRWAMEDLMLSQGIAVLPMHDAIIAPRSALEKTRTAMQLAFRNYVQVALDKPSTFNPKVTIKGEED